MEKFTVEEACANFKGDDLEKCKAGYQKGLNSEESDCGTNKACDEGYISGMADNVMGDL